MIDSTDDLIRLLDNGTPAVIAEAVERGATNPPGRSSLHGEDHWKSVALVGLYLARQMPETDWDLGVLLTFAMLHDIERRNDGADRDHGHRAAELFLEMVEARCIEGFDGERADDLAFALANHVGTGRVPADVTNPTVGLCWDADRLTLPRVGIEPDERYLSTKAARQDAAKTYGTEVSLQDEMPAWRDVLDAPSYTAAWLTDPPAFDPVPGVRGAKVAFHQWGVVRGLARPLGPALSPMHGVAPQFEKLMGQAPDKWQRPVCASGFGRAIGEKMYTPPADHEPPGAGCSCGWHVTPDPTILVRAFLIWRRLLEYYGPDGEPGRTLKMQWESMRDCAIGPCVIRGRVLPGTRESPWGTFRAEQMAITPGSTLMVPVHLADMAPEIEEIYDVRVHVVDASGVDFLKALLPSSPKICWVCGRNGVEGGLCEKDADICRSLVARRHAEMTYSGMTAFRRRDDWSPGGVAGF